MSLVSIKTVHKVTGGGPGKWEEISPLFKIFTKAIYEGTSSEPFQELSLPTVAYNLLSASMLIVVNSNSGIVAGPRNENVLASAHLYRSTERFAWNFLVYVKGLLFRVTPEKFFWNSNYWNFDSDSYEIQNEIWNQWKNILYQAEKISLLLAFLLPTLKNFLLWHRNFLKNIHIWHIKAFPVVTAS